MKFTTVLQQFWNLITCYYPSMTKILNVKNWKMLQLKFPISLFHGTPRAAHIHDPMNFYNCRPRCRRQLALKLITCNEPPNKVHGDPAQPTRKLRTTRGGLKIRPPLMWKRVIYRSGNLRADTNVRSDRWQTRVPFSSNRTINARLYKENKERRSSKAKRNGLNVNIDQDLCQADNCTEIRTFVSPIDTSRVAGRLANDSWCPLIFSKPQLQFHVAVVGCVDIWGRLQDTITHVLMKVLVLSYNLVNMHKKIQSNSR